MDQNRPEQGPDPEKGDPHIIKSPSDPKEYRFLELPNGLRVLLISASNLRFSEEASGEGESAASGEGETCEDSQSSEKEETYCWGTGRRWRRWRTRLSRSLVQMWSSLCRCLDRVEIDDCESDTAAAALCVAVGSFSEPDDLPGLAHFLEHMVFMGSEKYPEENGFSSFLESHGGSGNAFTEEEQTVFHFDIEKRHFRSALDRWAQFFISPLMIEDAVEREVEAVDSEFQQTRPSDSERGKMLLSSLARDGHPQQRFSWGNAQTLKLEPRDKGINVYERLQQFRRRYYTAQYMTLAVVTSESLDTLEQWVSEIFIHIPNNGEAAVDFSELQDPFDTPHFHKLYRVVPVKKVHALKITWSLPPQRQHYRVKPLYYVSWLLEHEGPGSVLSLLKHRFWAVSLRVEYCDQNSTHSSFSVSINLTAQGHAHFHQVAHVVFQYLRLLQSEGPQRRIYEEQQKIAEQEFQHQEQTDPEQCVEDLCVNMQLFPEEHFLIGNELLLDFDPQVISSVLQLLSPLRSNVMLLSPGHQGELTEKWFGTSFSVQDVPEEWERLWSSDQELNPELHLPSPNLFISSDFSLRVPDRPLSKFPVRIVKHQRGALWYKKDHTFKVPKAHVFFHLISPLIQSSAENVVLCDLLVSILTHNVAEEAFAANMAMISHRVMAAEDGLVISLEGFNHHLPLLLKLLVRHLANFSSNAEVFGVFSEQLKKVYFNHILSPANLNRDIRLQILAPSRWSVLDRQRVLVQGLDSERLLDFVSEFKQQLFVEGLVQGNVSATEAEEYLQYFIDELQFQPPPSEVSVLLPVVKLPQQHHVCKVKSVNPENNNTVVTVYYQWGLKSLRQSALLQLLLDIMEEPCFDFLRTKETLGYSVSSCWRNTSSVLGFTITVETQATKFSSEWVESKIAAFLDSCGALVSSLGAVLFRSHVESLVQSKSMDDTNLGEEVARNCREILKQEYVFDREEREVEALLSFSQDKLVSCFREIVNHNRKLSVHVVGFGEQEGDSPGGGAVSSLHDNAIELHFLPLSSPWLQQATPIHDISAFTAALPLHPLHKVPH